MIRAEPFGLSDLCQLEVQGVHKPVLPAVWSMGLHLDVLLGPWSWTAWDAYGRPVACIGILPNGYVWAFLAPDLKRNMVAITRGCRDIMDAHVAAKGPVYASIDDGYPEAVRWAKLLGFKRAWRNKWRYDGSTTPAASSARPA